MGDTVYQITIKNSSGSDQNYVLFNETPQISDVVQDDIWLNVFKKKVVPAGDTIKFKILKKFGAVCGYADTTPDNGVSVSVGQPKPVTLGQASSSGTLSKPGTTYTVEVKNGVPRFSTDPQTNGGKIGAFEIRTGDINYQDAKNNNWLIGLGGDTSGTGLDGPAATFVPQGHKSYQIKPITKYWISTVDYQEGSMIKVSSVADKSLAIDYSTISAYQVTVIHDSNGNLNLQA